MNPGPWGLLIIALVVLLLFGRGKIANMMGEVASGIKAFRKGMSEEEKPVAEIDQAPKSEADTTLNQAKEVDRSKDA
ncbi:twin-arginine translocase TatA/TatE family subunit [Pelagibacterium lentulum]|uniref:Sec-independent protein translocase protein TatA n=1 Tax=Pelagibacterium lentulum TaxID=2029865 RepID=A0A916REK7_9HYPH|nr:twin-arginine translocase TatA/TatE family subunit [Pelagibacterium lentulum]GGA53320.1 Sec-independent protein translocase protein TatA [Pelagibacterium lentulum]